MQVTGRASTTIQTHNAVSVGASGLSTQATWIDCIGYSDLSLTFLNDASTNNRVHLRWSNDGATIQGGEAILASLTDNYRAATTKVKARYAKLILENLDTSSHTMSAWIYLTS